MTLCCFLVWSGQIVKLRLKPQQNHIISQFHLAERWNEPLRTAEPLTRRGRKPPPTGMQQYRQITLMPAAFHPASDSSKHFHCLCSTGHTSQTQSYQEPNKVLKAWFWPGSAAEIKNSISSTVKTNIRKWNDGDTGGILHFFPLLVCQKFLTLE